MRRLPSKSHKACFLFPCPIDRNPIPLPVKTMAPILASALLLLLLHPSSSSLEDDALVLLSLKAATGSPLPTWDPARLHSVCSSWRGVRCSGHRIVSLDLSHSNLSGNITTVQFSSLDRLTDLSLAGNFLFGEINVANMTSLHYLNISGNQFSGTMDGWNSSTLPELQVLDVYDNNFTMQLPMGLASMAKLRYLDIGGNFFYGTIPENYGNFASLEFLSVAGNDLHGRIPASLGNLTTIKELVLGYFNSFSGGLPPELGKLISLLHLDVSSCELDGEIPLELGGLTSLSTLFLHTNRLSGGIPPSLGNLTSLTALDLSNNALTGEVPSSLSQLRQLRLLNLFLNRLHGSLPEFVAQLPMLETLQLFMNNFTGVLPETLGNNGALQVIDLSSNKLTGTIPEGLCYGSKLRVLILLKNFLFGGIPVELGRCSTLVRVRLGQNYLNGSIPSSFLYLPQLNLVELQSNYLSGVLSENLQPRREPSQLSQLNLSDNLLSGHLPVSLSNLSSLQMLTLSNNRLDGPIPTTIGALRKLVKLDLSGNAISGVIPLQLMGCSELTYLDLSRNNLSGPIPPEISGIAMLNYLNLSKNHFNLSIPKSIGGMKSLTSADFSHNDLSGKLPNNGQFAYFNASSFTGNPLLCNLCNSTITARSAHMVGKAPPGDWKIVLTLSLLICCLALVAAGAARARSKPNSSSSSSQWKLTAFCRVEFTAEDVVSCMKECNVIGRGGAGVVYVGRLSNGEEIAVKRLMGGFGQHSYDNGFKAEVRTLGNIRHRNIVRLLAFCSNRETNVLVYEYMRNGSLGAALHGNGGNGRKVTVCAGGGEESRRVVGWERRYGIAVEAARGLCYLHHDCSPMIVHRDVKSNNILLDSKLEAHVADFGLAKFLRDGGASECMSAIAGSYGYIAPEYAYTLKVDEKSDVYSYGVVLLELLTGRRPVGDFGEGVDIVHWAKATTSSRQEHVNRIIDSRLVEVPMDEATHIFFIAMLCVQDESVQRPTMREVVQMLSEFPHRLGEDRSTPSISQRSHSMGRDGNNNCYKIFN